MRPFEKYEKSLQEDLRNWANEHAEVRPEIFELLPTDPDTYKYQRMLHHTVIGVPLDGAVTDSIATSIEQRYPQFADAVDQNQQALKNMGETLDSLQNVIFASDHDELIDIALLLVRIRSNLQNMGYSFETGLIANKMVAHLGVKLQGSLIPATDLLAMAFDYTYLNLPRTQSGKEKLSAPKEAITSYNQFMIEHGLTKRLKSSRKLGRAMLIGAAVTGTVNKPLDTTQPISEEYEQKIPEDLADRTTVIGRANQGVLRITEQGLTFIGSAQIKTDEIKVTIPPHPLSIRTSEKLDDAMEQIASLQTSHDPDHHYVYDHLGVLPVKKH